MEASHSIGTVKEFTATTETFGSGGQRTKLLNVFYRVFIRTFRRFQSFLCIQFTPPPFTTMLFEVRIASDAAPISTDTAPPSTAHA